MAAAQVAPAEGPVSSGDVPKSMKPAHDAVWDTELFLNKESAQLWACKLYEYLLCI